MLDIIEIFNRLQCCYSCLIAEQAKNIDKLITDDVLDYKITKAYSLLQLKTSGYINTEEDYKLYQIAVNEICGGCDCTDDFKWIGIEPICEEDTVNTSTTSTSSSTSSTTSPSTSTSSSTSTSTQLTTSTSTSTTSTSTTNTTSTSTTTTNTTTSSTSTTSSNGVETLIVPNWLLRYGLSSNADTHENSLYVGATQDVELRIETLDGTTVGGYTQVVNPNDTAWNNTMYIPGTTLYVEFPYTEVFRLNPVALGNGGLIPGTSYKFSLRRQGDNSLRFVKFITIPTTSQGVTDVPLTSGIGSTSTTSSTSTTTISGGIVYNDLTVYYTDI